MFGTTNLIEAHNLQTATWKRMKLITPNKQDKFLHTKSPNKLNTLADAIRNFEGQPSTSPKTSRTNSCMPWIQMTWCRHLEKWTRVPQFIFLLSSLSVHKICISRFDCSTKKSRSRSPNNLASCTNLSFFFYLSNIARSTERKLSQNQIWTDSGSYQPTQNQTNIIPHVANKSCDASWLK